MNKKFTLLFRIVVKTTLHPVHLSKTAENAH